MHRAPTASGTMSTPRGPGPSPDVWLGRFFTITKAHDAFTGMRVGQHAAIVAVPDVQTSTRASPTGGKGVRLAVYSSAARAQRAAAIALRDAGRSVPGRSDPDGAPPPSQHVFRSVSVSILKQIGGDSVAARTCWQQPAAAAPSEHDSDADADRIPTWSRGVEGGVCGALTGRWQAQRNSSMRMQVGVLLPD